MMIRSIPPASAHLALEARAGPAADDRLALGDLPPEPFENLMRTGVEHGDLIEVDVGSGQELEQELRAAASANAGSLMCSSRIDEPDPGDGRPARRSGPRRGRRRPRGRGTAGRERRAPRPRGGESRATRGVVDAARTSAIRRPSAAFSSGVVRIRVTDGLCTWKRRPRTARGRWLAARS